MVKIGAVSAGYYTNRNQLDAIRLKRLASISSVDKVYHFYRGKPKPFSQEKIEHVRIGKEKFSFRKPWREIKIFSKDLQKKATEKDIGILYNFDQRRAAFSYYFTSLKKMPFLQQIGVDLRYLSRIPKLWNFIMKPYLENCEKVVFLAHHLKNQFEKLDIDSKVIYPLLGLESFYRKGKLPEPSFEEPTLLYVGRMNRAKGILKALKAFPKVLEDHPSCVFEIVGDTLKGNTRYYKLIFDT